ncbi:response regulator [Lachnospiraceae bacterium MD335]|nr:response regulator [Lachnospiraceae bacterium MD335]
MNQMNEKEETLLLLDENTIPIVRRISDRMPGGFFIYRADGSEELIFTNNALLRIFGCNTEAEFRKLTGYTFPGMVHPEDLETVQRSIANQIANSRYDLDYVEYRIIQKDGSVRWVEDYGHFVHTQIYGDIFYVFIDDATERMKTRMEHLETMNNELGEVYERELQYRKAILHDAILFFEVNLTKNELITKTLLNIEGIQGDDLYGLTETEQVKTYSDYVKDKESSIDLDSVTGYRQFFDAERLIECCEQGEIEQTYDVWMTDVLGRKRLCHYVFLLGKNKTTGDIVALVVAKDITEQMERQKLLQSALRQARAANIARDTFLVNMSHDIRTPLNAIIGYAELLKSRKSDPEKVDDYLDKIRASSEQLLSILNESLEVTRMESGRVNLIESECNLGELFAEIKKSVLPIMKKKSIRFRIDSTGVEHFAVIADFIRIKEVLMQLLDNAAKYMNPDGTITLTIAETEIDMKGYKKYRFIVEDNGIGISEKFKEQLFDPFKRENNTTHSGVLGIGLGLTVVKNFVEMMEGDIAVESELGKGSKFTVSLLLKLQEESEKTRIQASDIPRKHKSSKSRRLLVVEDNEINCEIVEELLKDKGYLVETAANGRIALEMVENAKDDYFAAILMDIQMPEMDGYEATRAIRGLENPALAQIPIIALSANAFAEDYQKSIDAGMVAHFPKPINIDALHDLISRILED